jgi:hypothetical protein
MNADALVDRIWHLRRLPLPQSHRRIVASGDVGFEGSEMFAVTPGTASEITPPTCRSRKIFGALLTLLELFLAKTNKKNSGTRLSYFF